jgi:hypothetical protein
MPLRVAHTRSPLQQVVEKGESASLAIDQNRIDIHLGIPIDSPTDQECTASHEYRLLDYQVTLGRSLPLCGALRSCICNFV